jgi:hypothetical protein
VSCLNFGRDLRVVFGLFARRLFRPRRVLISMV